MNETKTAPMPEDLPAEELQALQAGLAIAEETGVLGRGVVKVEQVGDEWRDDHIDCVQIAVTVEGREPIVTSLWWCGPVIIGALKYADESPKAMNDVLTELNNHVQNAVECAEGVECERCGAECTDTFVNTLQGETLCPKCAEGDA